MQHLKNTTIKDGIVLIKKKKSTEKRNEMPFQVREFQVH